MTRCLLIAVLSVGLIASACTGDGDPTPSATTATQTSDASTFAAEVASSDLAAGSPESVQLGVFSSTAEAGVRVLSFGEIGVAFDFLGADGSQPPAPGPATTARFVPAPGTDTARAEGPTLTSPSEVAGVYITPEVTLPEAGIWNATVTVVVDGAAPVSLEAAFTVYPEHRIPAPGEEALKTKNLTIESEGAPAVAIDSRAQDGARVPDPELHATTIAEALRQGRPALVQFATPCVLRQRVLRPHRRGSGGAGARVWRRRGVHPRGDLAQVHTRARNGQPGRSRLAVT